MNKTEAKNQAESVRKRMHNPKQWKVRLWENLGWHWALDCGQLTIHCGCYTPASNKLRFSCMLTTDKESVGSGEMFWTDDQFFDDPNDAVSHQITLAVDHLNKCVGAVNSVTDRIGIPRDAAVVKLEEIRCQPTNSKSK